MKLTLLSLVLFVSTLCAAQSGNAPCSTDFSNFALSTSGLISGMPNIPGTCQFTAQVCDSETPAACATAIITIQVISPVVITSTTAPNASQGKAYSFQLAAAGGLAPYKWNLIASAPTSGIIFMGPPVQQ